MKKTYTLIILILFLIITTSLATVIIYNKYKVLDITTLDIDFEVKNTIGFNTDTDNLHFGIIPPGSQVIREFHINNDFQNPIKIYMRITPSQEWFKLSDNNFPLQPNQSKTIQLSIQPPTNTPHKNYTAKLNIFSLRT